MSAIAVPFRQLVERRLWPLAVLLVLALLAVPMLLAKSAEPTFPGPVASAATAGGTESALATKPIVSIGDESAIEARRRVLGKRKNPFEPAVRARKADVEEVSAPPTVADPNKGGSGGASGPTGITLPGGAVVTTPGGLPKKKYELYSLTVRFGASTSEKLNRRNLKRLTSLPSVANPVLIYLGLLGDGKTAVFLVDAAATVQGDGVCNPDPANCQTLHMKPGETAFFDVKGEGGEAQYQLDFVKVKVAKTTDAKAAARSRAAVAKGGRKALRARQSRAGAYRYDRKTGTIRKLSDSELKAEAAARAARD